MAQNRGREPPRPPARRGPDRRHPEIPPGSRLPRQPARRARGRACPLGQAIVDTAEEAGSQNTIRDHLERPGGARSAPSSPSSRAATWTAPSASSPRPGATSGRGRWTTIVRGMRGARRRAASGRSRSSGRSSPATAGATTPTPGGICPFVQLLERVHAIDGIERIRFTSPHPRGFRQDLVDAFAPAAEARRARPPAGAVGQQPDPAGHEPALHARALP